MSPEQFHIVDRVFNTALAMPSAERAAYIATECADDPAVHRAVEDLLAQDDRTQSALDTPAVMPGAALVEAANEDPLVGTTVGAYRIENCIGRGGMGAVYLATRADDQFDKRVALKVVRSSMDSAELRRRFRHERQTLARLDHPYIARLLDGGSTASGLPYLVMEYIDGQPIDRYCAEHDLSTAARIELFIKVCEAVHYAHRNLVVHRDLKPSNIQLTADGTPHLLDFGVAKMLEDDAPALTRTATAARFLTPEYASPEQVLGAAITTASDVYTLGVVLYELLAGYRPYRVDARTSTDLHMLICEVDPPRPSTMVRKMATGAQREGRVRALSGDLDNIIMMALRKEPERRYRSVEQLAEDLRRHLDGHPVLARKDTFLYRSTKFVLRNRRLVGAACVVALTLILGIIGTSWQARRASSEAGVARSVRGVLDNLIRRFDPTQLGGGGELRRYVDEVVPTLIADLRDHPQDQVEFMHTIAIFEMNQGRFDVAAHWYREALAVQTRQFAADHPAVAAAEHDLGWALFRAGEHGEALQRLQRALTLRRQYTDEPEAVGDSLAAVGLALLERGDLADAGPYLDEALSLRRTLAGSRDEDRARLTDSLIHQGRRMTLEMRYDEAEDLLHESLKIADDLDHAARRIDTRLHLAMLFHDTARYTAAERMLRATERITRQAYGRDHPVMGEVLIRLAEVRSAHLRDVGTTRSGLAGMARQAVGMFERYPPRAPHTTTEAQLTLANVLRQIGHRAEAATLADEVLESSRALFPDDDLRLAAPLVLAAEVAFESARLDDAEALCSEALDILTTRLPPEHPRIALTHNLLGLILVARGYTQRGAALLHLSTAALTTRQPAHSVAVEMALCRLHAFCAMGDDAAEKRACRNLWDRSKAARGRGFGRVDINAESAASIDYDDDVLEKTIILPTALDGDELVTLWICGKPFNWPGLAFVDRDDYYIRINDREDQRIHFDVGLAFHGLIEEYHWVPFAVPPAWLEPGPNRFYVGKDPLAGHWYHNNLYVGIDTSHDHDHSWWYGNAELAGFDTISGTPQPQRCTGELMMQLVIHGADPGLTGERFLEDTPPSEAIHYLVTVADARFAAEDHAVAERLYGLAHELIGSHLHSPYGTAIACLRGVCLVQLGRYEQAEAILLDGHAYFVEHTNESAGYVTRTRNQLVSLYDAWGRTDRAQHYRALLRTGDAP